MKPMVYKAELCANKVVSDSLELVDFAIGLVNSFPDLLDGQVKFFFWGIRITEVLQNKLLVSIPYKFIWIKSFFKLIWQHEIIEITCIITMNK